MIITDINGNKRECSKVEEDQKFSGFVKVFFKSKVRAGFEHFEWFPVKEFLKANPGLKSKIKTFSLQAKEDLGVVTSSGSDYLKDASKNWKKDLYKAFPLWISRGKGEGQQRKVVKNTKDTLFIDKNWEVKPDRSSQYVLSRNVQENILPMGNTLPDLKTKEPSGDIIKKGRKK